MTGALAVLFLGVALLIGAAIFASMASRARRLKRAKGTVTGLDPGSSGDYPIVTFAPEGNPTAGGREVTFRDRRSQGSFRIGEQHDVFYDPLRPESATLFDARQLWLVALILAGVGLLMFPLAAMLGLYLAPLSEGRDAAVEAFLGAVRRGDEEALRGATIEGAQLDRAFLEREIRPTTGFEATSSDIGFDDTSCIRGHVSSGAQLVMRLEKRGDRWQVVRAGNRDAECDADLDAM